jgi:uncharacterized protein YraI
MLNRFEPRQLTARNALWPRPGIRAVCAATDVVHASLELRGMEIDMNRHFASGLLRMALLALPGAALAQLAYTSKDAHLRAGPARDYPVIAILVAGSEVAVQGCLGDYSWCDVLAGPDRGWVYAANLEYPYGSGYVPLLDYGAAIGIAVIGFTLFDYWADHYPARPFYRDRDQWAYRPRPPRAVGPGIAPPGPPVRGVSGTQPAPPPRPGAPGVQRPPPPQRGSPGGPHPPPRQGAPGRERPPPPQQHRPGEQHP